MNHNVATASEGMLPVHLAVLTGNQTMVLYLCDERILDRMTYEDIEKLFFMSISNNMFDAAVQVFKKYPKSLASARYQEAEEKLTALHMLVHKPSDILKDDNGKGTSTDVELFTMIVDEIKTFKEMEIMELITKPSAVLFDAIKSGHDVVVKLLLSLNLPLFIKDHNNAQNLVHLLAQYRHFDYYNYIDFKREQIIRAVDTEGNNVLHMAAHLPLQFQAFSGLRASIQMKEELAWFNKVKERVPMELRRAKNKKGKTPMDVFYDEHKKLSGEIKESAKGITNSGMIVATLVAASAFAASVTVLGGKKNDWLVVFIITNAIALFTSSTSILFFLTNLTSSSFVESDFFISLDPSLIFGPLLLSISVAAMVLTFIVTSFMIFEDKSKWVPYVVATMGVYPLFRFLWAQFNFFNDLIYYHPKQE